MILTQENSLVLIIDIQEKLLNAVFNKDTLTKKAKILVESAQKLGLPVLITEQYPQGLGSTIADLSSNAQIYTKTKFNALSDEKLYEDLRRLNKQQIIVMGIETHICVYQTVCALLEKGFEVSVVKDACGSRAEFEYRSALDIMKDKGAEIKTTEMILFEILKEASHPKFKEIQHLIK